MEQATHAPEEFPTQERGSGGGPYRKGIIYIGQKNVMSYVLAVVTQFNAGEKQVQIKARGRAISRAVDVTQIVKSRFFNTLEIPGFKAETETLNNEDGTTSRVSSLTLTLTK